MVNLWYKTIQKLDYRSEKRSPPESDRRAVLDDLKSCSKKEANPRGKAVELSKYTRRHRLEMWPYNTIPLMQRYHGQAYASSLRYVSNPSSTLCLTAGVLIR